MTDTNKKKSGLVDLEFTTDKPTNDKIKISPEAHKSRNTTKSSPKSDHKSESKNITKEKSNDITREKSNKANHRKSDNHESNQNNKHADNSHDQKTHELNKPKKTEKLIGLQQEENKKKLAVERKGFLTYRDSQNKDLKIYFRYLGPPNVNFEEQISKSIDKIILFVGTIGVDTRIWKYQQDEFSTIYMTLAIDLRGCGKSDKPEDSNYSYDNFTSDIKHVLDKFNIKKIIYVGVGVGASVGISFASRYPQLVERLLLSGAIPWHVVNTKSDYFHAECTRNELENTWKLIETNYASYCKAMVNNSLYVESEAELKNKGEVIPHLSEMKDISLQLLESTNNKVILRLLGKENTESFVFDSLFPAVKSLNEKKIPILIVFGSASPVIYKGSAGFLFTSLLKVSHIYEFLDRGLLPNITDSERFNIVLDNFIHAIN